jgi:hypothetical protein
MARAPRFNHVMLTTALIPETFLSIEQAANEEQRK